MADSINAGYISDESSFYGDDETRQALEDEAKRQLQLPYQFPWTQAKPKIQHSVSSQQSRPQDDAVNFLKSRPQIARMQNAAAEAKQSTKKGSGRTVEEEEAAEFLNENRFEGVASAWQQNETVKAFLKRAPVADPETARLGHWLWVANPKPIRSQQKHQAKADIDAFAEGGQQLLEAFSLQKHQVESANPDKAPATITRKMRPYKEQLEDDLLQLAVQTATTCGKWMLFPSDDDYPRYWRLVAEATADGRLGILSKAATYSPVDPVNLICVYTYDFTDQNDIRRVLDELVDLGVCRADGKPIYYKCDGYTYLGITSDNPYKIRASLYSSKDILQDEAKPTPEGPIARLQKRSQTIENFLAS